MKVLLATDGSECSRMATEKWCLTFAKRRDLEIRIVSVYHPHTPVGTFSLTQQYRDYFADYAQMLYKKAEQNISEAAAIVRKSFGETQLALTSSTLKGVTDKSIIEEAKRWNADLIVLGSHGYEFWQRMMIGSVSDSIIHHAPSSVLIVKDKSAGKNRQQKIMANEKGCDSPSLRNPQQHS